MSSARRPNTVGGALKRLENVKLEFKASAIACDHVQRSHVTCKKIGTHSLRIDFHVNLDIFYDLGRSKISYDRHHVSSTSYQTKKQALGRAFTKVWEIGVVVGLSGIRSSITLCTVGNLSWESKHFFLTNMPTSTGTQVLTGPGSH